MLSYAGGSGVSRRTCGTLWRCDRGHLDLMMEDGTHSRRIHFADARGFPLERRKPRRICQGLHPFRERAMGLEPTTSTLARRQIRMYFSYLDEFT